VPKEGREKEVMRLTFQPALDDHGATAACGHDVGLALLVSERTKRCV
jgi:hypothetical protein